MVIDRVSNRSGYAHSDNKTPGLSSTGIFFSKPQNIEIVVSITPQSVHGGPMGRDATARAIDVSLWGLAFLILGGTILAYLIW
jgi:hypothetical protein